MYFYWTHPYVVHKYLALHNRLKKKCDVLTIIGEGEFGISREAFSLFKEEDTEDVILQSVDDALKTLQEVDFKVGVFSSNGRKGWVGPNGETPPELGARHPNVGRDIKIAKEKGAISVQISEMITDFYYGGADVVSLISPAMKTMHTDPRKYGTFHQYQWRPFDANPKPKYIYSNCLLWDNIEECMPYHLTREQFCDKYKLDEDKDIILFLPSAANCVTSGLPKQVYKKVCDLDNVVIKLHPKEYKRLSAHSYDHKWSYELCGVDKEVRILEEIDAHWCYKYASCAISNQSSVSIEFPLYNTPFLYVSAEAFPWCNLFLRFGHRCNLSNLKSFIEEKKYNEEISGLKEFYNEHVLTDSSRTAVEILEEQLLDLL